VVIVPDEVRGQQVCMIAAWVKSTADKRAAVQALSYSLRAAFSS
jgi:hypothetical protein